MRGRPPSGRVRHDPRGFDPLRSNSIRSPLESPANRLDLARPIVLADPACADTCFPALARGVRGLLESVDAREALRPDLTTRQLAELGARDALHTGGARWPRLPRAASLSRPHARHPAPALLSNLVDGVAGGINVHLRDFRELRGIGVLKALFAPTPSSKGPGKGPSKGPRVA